MGATSFHQSVPKKNYESAKQAFRELVEDALYEHGHDPYSGTIATCSLSGEINEPESDKHYENALEELSKRECVYFETQDKYHFIGWASC